jgi:hypothetical protein
MKLKHFEHLEAYCFVLTFDNGEIKKTDLKDLIGHYVALKDISTARIDSDWGCLEFNNGMVDIEPKTLYEFATVGYCQQAA